MKNYIGIFSVVLLIQGCGWTVSPLGSSPDYLRNRDGNLVSDCNGGALFRKSWNTDAFWEKNNLPKGTTDFTCVDGKAYLRGKEPR